MSEFPITAKKLQQETGIPIDACRGLIQASPGAWRIGNTWMAYRADVEKALTNSRVNSTNHESTMASGSEPMGGQGYDPEETKKLLRVHRGGRTGKSGSIRSGRDSVQLNSDAS